LPLPNDQGAASRTRLGPSIKHRALDLVGGVTLMMVGASARESGGQLTQPFAASASALGQLVLRDRAAAHSAPSAELRADHGQ